MGDGGLPQAQNTNFKTMYNNGNEVYTAPLGLVSDMYRHINKDFYTIHREGQFVLQTTNKKTQTDASFSTNLSQPLFKSNSGAYHHVYLDLTKYCAKTLKYIDDPAAPVDQNCTNDSMYLTYTICRFDNVVIPDNVIKTTNSIS